jgi:hypothetical protein
MEPRDTSLDVVRHRLAERQRYDGWLATLEARRHDTPARVFARVHDDYQARRTEVLARLTARRPASTLTTRLVKLSAGTHRLLVRMARENQQGNLTVALHRADGAPASLTFKPATGPAPRWDGVKADGDDGLYASAESVREALARARTTTAATTRRETRWASTARRSCARAPAVSVASPSSAPTKTPAA